MEADTTSSPSLTSLCASSLESTAALVRPVANMPSSVIEQWQLDVEEAYSRGSVTDMETCKAAIENCRADIEVCKAAIQEQTNNLEACECIVEKLEAIREGLNGRINELEAICEAQNTRMNDFEGM